MIEVSGRLGVSFNSRVCIHSRIVIGLAAIAALAIVRSAILAFILWVTVRAAANLVLISLDLHILED